MALKYPPFAANEEIRNAAKSNPSLKFGSNGGGVFLLQAGLIELGYKLPDSTIKTGFPDGKYGKETKKVIIQYQTDAKFTLIDGIAGKDTIASMDKKLAAKKAKPIAPPSPPIVPKPLPPSNKNYTLGSSDPAIKPDKGSGVFDSSPTEVSMWALKQTILEILPPRGNSATAFIGVDAARHMKHYLDASGAKLTIDLESMVAAGPTAKARLKDEVNQAKKFVESLSPGTHKITSLSSEGAYNYKTETWNWFYAVGGYQSWGKGTAKVSTNGTKKQYELDFEYHVFDRYNWDKGKSVTIGPITITDEFMGEFHRQGLAQEFDMKGVIKRKFSWVEGTPIPDSQYQRGGGR